MAAPSSALQEVYGCPNYRGAFEDDPDVNRVAYQAAEVGPGLRKGNLNDPKGWSGGLFVMRRFLKDALSKGLQRRFKVSLIL